MISPSFDGTAACSFTSCVLMLNSVTPAAGFTKWRPSDSVCPVTRPKTVTTPTWPVRTHDVDASARTPARISSTSTPPARRIEPPRPPVECSRVIGSRMDPPAPRRRGQEQLECERYRKDISADGSWLARVPHPRRDAIDRHQQRAAQLDEIRRCVLVCRIHGCGNLAGIRKTPQQLYLQQVDRIHIRIAHVDRSAQDRIGLEQLTLIADDADGVDGMSEPHAQRTSEALKIRRNQLTVVVR